MKKRSYNHDWFDFPPSTQWFERVIEDFINVIIIFQIISLDSVLPSFLLFHPQLIRIFNVRCRLDGEVLVFSLHFVKLNFMSSILIVSGDPFGLLLFFHSRFLKYYSCKKVRRLGCGVNDPESISSAPGEQSFSPMILFIFLVVNIEPSSWDRWWIFRLIRKHKMGNKICHQYMDIKFNSRAQIV